MRHTNRLFVLAACAALLAACGRDDAPTAPQLPNANQGIIAGTLQVSAAKPVLTLRNTTEFVVGYMVVDKDQATIALYPPCGDNCPKIVQGASATVNYSAISGYTPASREATVMWWKYVPRNGSLQPEGGVQTTHVRLD